MNMQCAEIPRLVALAWCFALLATPKGLPAAPAEECGKAPPEGKATCYEKALDKVLAEQGTEAALTALERYTKDDPVALREAHPLVHHIGRRSFAFYKDARIAMSHCKDTFWSGCYHGVLEGYLGSLPEIEPRHVVPLCEDEGDTKRSLFEKYNCVHGLGHGLTINFQHDVLKSLAFCDALPTDWDRQSCYGGVFMEMIVSFQNNLRHGSGDGHHAHHKSFLNPENPHYPCSALAERYLQACYLMQSSAILTFSGYDFAKAFAQCDKAPEAFVTTCYRSMGRDISGFTLRDVAKTVKLCQLGRQERQQDCLTGAVKDFILTHADPERGLAVCRALPGEQKAGCYGTVGEMLVSLYPEAGPREEACARSEPAFIETCKGTAAVQ